MIINKESSACDLLSELPDSLIFEIFRFLPMTDVVRTTILSKRWNNLWTTFPWLDFNDRRLKIDTDKFRDFVNGIVNSWRGMKIVRFNVEFRESDPNLNKSLPSDSDIDSWIQFATEKKVEQLQIFLAYKFSVPQCLYSCSSLKVLQIMISDPQVHGNVQWDQLRRLTLFAEGFTKNAIDRILRGSPRLRKFNLILRSSKGDLRIKSSSLRQLSIIMFYKKDARVVEDPELRIWAPNLEKLEIGGVPYSKCFLMNVSSLTRVALNIDGPKKLFPGIDFVGETLRRIFPAIKHVQKLTLSNWCIKALGAMKGKHILKPFPTPKILILNVCCEEHPEEYPQDYPEEYQQQILGVVEMFSTLRNLVLVTNYNGLPEHFKGCLVFDKNLSILFLLHLRTVHITWTIGDDNSISFYREIKVRSRIHCPSICSWHHRSCWKWKYPPQLRS
ncbi:putative F-box protein At1g49610 isoform X2 [Salvia miltiorrhiza]|uniref:putative F-box protein At1g49610 isoform X2 n=1 Tax=Salvia miltiorrhiza TaxID=226208 RepID=UPI0025AC6923|nr:putative F-box protein At1g49610 isoform X2 [Salvia miltiorrhiza]